MKRINPADFKQNSVVISENPYIKVYKKFLSQNEIKNILKYAESATFDRSETTDDYDLIEDEDNGVISEDRTSSTVFIPEDHPISKNITAKVCAIVKCDPLDVEKIQIVRYYKGQCFKLHHDSYLDEEGLHRDHTFFIYLNTIKNGSGTTNFPNLNLRGSSGVKFQPYAGAAVHWLNLTCNVSKDDRPIRKRCDKRLMHTGSKVQGNDNIVKFGMNVWIRTPRQDCNKGS